MFLFLVLKLFSFIFGFVFNYYKTSNDEHYKWDFKRQQNAHTKSILVNSFHFKHKQQLSQANMKYERGENVKCLKHNFNFRFGAIIFLSAFQYSLNQMKKKQRNFILVSFSSAKWNLFGGFVQCFSLSLDFHTILLMIAKLLNNNKTQNILRIQFIFFRYTYKILILLNSSIWTNIFQSNF